MKTTAHSAPVDNPTSKRHRQLTRIALALLLVLLLITGYVLRTNPELFNSGETTCLRNPSRERLCWALIGNDGARLQEERAAGVRAKLFSLSWRAYAPREGSVDQTYVARKRAELEQLRRASFAVMLNLGFHDTPSWLHTNYRNTRYVNQHGDHYDSNGAIDSGDANLVFNPQLRSLVAAYVKDVFATFGDTWAGVRLGGGRYGELTYPPAQYAGRSNSYWAFDPLALAQSPTPTWKPGQTSRSGKAGLFLNWYLDQLVTFQNWQIALLRQHYNGPLLMLYPSWGIRPGQIEQALETYLDGSTPAERNGELQRGFDFARQIAALSDPQVLVTSTWLDADASGDSGRIEQWSPIKYLASLAQAHPLRLGLYGENTGRGRCAAMELSAAQVRRYGLLGMAWYREEELFSGEYAGLDDYQRIIAAYAALPTTGTPARVQGCRCSSK